MGVGAAESEGADGGEAPLSVDRGPLRALRIYIEGGVLQPDVFIQGLVMNGGVLHAVECLTAEELSDAESGYRFYGLDTVACLLSRTKAILVADDDLEFHEPQLDVEYQDTVPDDDVIVKLFQKQLKASPSDYAQLRAKDIE